VAATELAGDQERQAGEEEEGEQEEGRGEEAGRGESARVPARSTPSYREVASDLLLQTFSVHGCRNLETAPASTANVVNLIFPFVLASTRPLRVCIEISNGGRGNVRAFRVACPRDRKRRDGKA